MKNNLGVYVSTFFLIISSIIFFKAMNLDYYGEYGPGPGLLPRWSSGALIVLSLINIVVSKKKNIIKFSEVLPKDKGLVNILVFLGSLLVFMLLVSYTGFIIASTLMLFFLFSRNYKWYWALGTSIFISLFLFWAFGSMLMVPLPVNALGW